MFLAEDKYFNEILRFLVQINHSLVIEQHCGKERGALCVDDN